MKYFCENCSHTGADHPGGGRCEGESYDPDYGRYRCMCWAFERDGDD